MDTSKENIEMVLKAWELHDLWHMKNGDFYYEQNGKNDKEFCVFIWDFGALRCETTKGKTWLPRQDQLQDMVVSKKAQYVNGLPYITFIELFHQFVEKCWHQFNSMEQLWLAFVMHENYGKRWMDGTDWVVK